MKTADQLIAMHRDMRKLAYERVGSILVKTIQEKLGSGPVKEESSAPRSDQPR